MRRDYLLDSVGRVTTIARSAALAEQYAYDPLGNITSTLPTAISAYSTIEAGGAPVGEGVASQADKHSGQREYRNSLLTRDGRTRYHYDASGRLIRKTTTRLSRKPDIWHYRYNSFDQLTDVWTPEHQWWHYTYDALGRRTTKQHQSTDGTVLERIDYTWDGTHLVEQSTATTVTRWHYQPDSYTPITQTTDQDTIDREFFAIITDLVGTPVEMIDPDTPHTAATAATGLWGNTTWPGKRSGVLVSSSPR